MTLFKKFSGQNEETTHALSNAKIQILEKDINASLPERFGLASTEGLEISKRITVGPYGLENDYGDKFVPAADSYIDPNDKTKFVVVVDLLDAEAKVKVKSRSIIIDGKRDCLVSENSSLTTTSRLCGKFMKTIRPPPGYDFEKEKITLDEKNCHQGVCTFEVTIDDDGDDQKYDL